MPPIAWPHATILILGSLPGDVSLSMQQYYANPRNHFWSILGEIFGEPVGADWNSRVAFLERHGIALWDVLASADRIGSLDGNIRNARHNDFAELIARMPALRTIAINGGKAASLFDRFVLPSISAEPYRILRLPSTSPIPGRNVLSIDEKIAKWTAIIAP